MIRILLLVFLILINCKKEYKIENDQEYLQFIKSASSQICTKIKSCYQSYIRTIPLEYQSIVSQEECIKKSTEFLDNKLKSHNSVVRNLSKKCYESLIQSTCNRFMIDMITDPICNAYKVEIEKMK